MVENFLPYAFTVLHDALDSKKNAPNKAFSLLDKNIFSDLSIYLLIYSFFFFALLQEDTTKITIHDKSKTKYRTKNNRNHER